MDLQGIVLIIAATINLLLAILILVKNYKNETNSSYFILAFWIFLWSIGIAMFRFENELSGMLFWNREFILTSGFIAGSFVHFSSVFPEKKKIFGWLDRILIYFPSIIISVGVFIPDLFIKNIIVQPWGNESVLGWGYLFFGFYFTVFSTWTLINLFLQYKKASGKIKKQVMYVMVGFFLTLLFGAFFNLYLILLGNYKYIWVGPNASLILAFFMGYTIIKYQLLSIRVIAVEFISYGILLTAVFQLLFADSLLKVIGYFIILVVLAILVAILIKNMRGEINRKNELQKMSEELAKANDKLTKLDNAKSEFISIASHQLRTPLTAIKGFVSLLLEGSYGKVDVKQQDVLNKVYTSNSRLINLVEDLLNISRMESGRMEFKLEPTNLKDICKEVIDTFYIKAKDAKLKLEYKPGEKDIPKVMIDGIKMKEVISNLVDNAIKYCPKGGVTLRLVAGVGSNFVGQNTPDKNHFGSDSKVQNGEVVRVVISDTGIGIPTSELPYLFVKFSRGKDISRLNTGGTGLGLYVGKGIVEANGSNIWAESDGQGKGSRFIVEIPVEQDPEIIKKWS